MNLLIVDDQRAVVDGLRNSLDWKYIGIDSVYTACSAREARLILPNFDIDILLTDIEMPEEDGLSLFRWTKTRYPEIVGIFLTSHADFDYAREALQMGSFDYILQPARNEEVQEVIIRAVAEARKNANIRRMEKLSSLVESQREGMLELLLVKTRSEEWEECKALLGRIGESLEPDDPQKGVWGMAIQIFRYGVQAETWDEKLVCMIFRNVLEELFEKNRSHAIVAKMKKDQYFVLVGEGKNPIDQGTWGRELEEFYHFVAERMGFSIALYPEMEEIMEFDADRKKALMERMAANMLKKPGIFRENIRDELDIDVNIERIRNAESFIRNNLGRGISRSEVAEYLHLNEEYFSRLFKKYTGLTFKEYEMQVRLEQAKKLLEYSRISVSIIASKIGYDNFSHFSRAFKKETGMTPQEYRKAKTGK